MPGSDQQRFWAKALHSSVLLIFVVLLAFPFYWMFIADV